MYMTLAFLALLGAPYIYEISSLRVNIDSSSIAALLLGPADERTRRRFYTMYILYFIPEVRCRHSFVEVDV